MSIPSFLIRKRPADPSSANFGAGAFQRQAESGRVEATGNLVRALILESFRVLPSQRDAGGGRSGGPGRRAIGLGIGLPSRLCSALANPLGLIVL
jgi:hypothetical protein